MGFPLVILVSNDDGVHSEGLRVLAKGLEVLGEVFVVAPDRERSAAGHSLTLNRPLRATQLAPNCYAVDGTPTDCITLAVMRILEGRPDLVISGINMGPNLGDDVTYSGTVSAAFEATLLGIPAFAVSVVAKEDFFFQGAADFSLYLAELTLRKGLPPDTLLNVNVPNLPLSEIAGVEITRQGKRVYSDSIVEKMDPRGRAYYWIGGEEPTWERLGGTDYEAVMENKISITPLHLDLTNYAALEELKNWDFRAFPSSRP